MSVRTAPCHNCDTCPATYKDMVPDYEMSKKATGRWFYFRCTLCNKPSYVMRRDIDPANPTWRPAVNSKYTLTRASPAYLNGKRGPSSIPIHHKFSQKKNKKARANIPPAKRNAPRAAPSSEKQKKSEPENAHDLPQRAELAEKVLVMFEDIKTLGLRRIELVDLEKEREEAFNDASEFVKKCKQEWLITRGEILEVDKREKELSESVPELVRALAASK